MSELGTQCINEERLSVTNLSSENNLNNLPMFQLNAAVVIRAKASSQNIGKLFSDLKLGTDNLFIYAEAS